MSNNTGLEYEEWADEFTGESFGPFDHRIQNGLSDLIDGALGIRRSKIPAMHTAGRLAKEEERKLRQQAGGVGRSAGPPKKQITLQFPLNYFSPAVTVPATSTDGTVERDFPNSIHFRTLTRTSVDASEIEAPEKLKEIAAMAGVDLDSDVGDYGSVVGKDEEHYDIFLHLPEKLQDEVKVEYGEAKGGAMAQFMARLFSFGSKDAVNDMEGKRNFDINEIMKAFQGMMPGGEIIQKAAGFMANPMAFQAMKNVNFRTYNYSFQLKPTSAMEAAMIRNIVFAFKKSMLPGTAGENHGIWTLPNEWSIQFCGPIANWVDFPLTAVCTSCTIDYSTFLMAADPTSALRDKGRGAPGSITLGLSFVETMQLSRQRYSHEVAPKGQVRQGSEAGTKIGNALTFWGSEGEIGSSDLSFEEQSAGQAVFYGKEGYDAEGNYVGERASVGKDGYYRDFTSENAGKPDHLTSSSKVELSTMQKATVWFFEHGMWFFRPSDIRLKENIEYISQSNGLNIYEYNYIWSKDRYRGIIAQELLNIKPEAVSIIDGYYMVDYSLLDINLEKVV